MSEAETEASSHSETIIRRTSPQFVLLAAIMAVSVAIAFFAATATATADPIVRPYAIAIALALCISLILFGWVDINRASKGLLWSSISLLPNLLSWGVKTTSRSLLIAGLFAAIAFAFIWYGPGNIITQTVQCGEASHVEFSIRSDKLDCEGAATRKVWLLPMEQPDKIQLSCFDPNANRWTGTYKHAGVSTCGKRPQNAQFVTNGIKGADLDTTTTTGQRFAEGLDRLRKGLNDAGIPDRKIKDRLIFATWNIRNLGRFTKGPNRRLDESYAYIAEVISHFDIVAVQELQDRRALKRILDLLGDDYRAEFSFISPGPAGNRERMGFIYDSRKVSFGDISTTIVFESVEGSTINTGQPARPPFLAEFVVNDRSFFAVTAHTFFGSMRGEKFEQRLRELEQMAQGLDKTFERNFPDHPVIFAGDLNVSRPDGPEMEKLLNNGFNSLEELRELGTNIASTRPYDQILIRSANAGKMPIGEFGVFKPTDFVFRTDDLSLYRIDMQKLSAEIGKNRKPDERYYRQFQTYQISDHHVKWAEFRIDW